MKQKIEYSNLLSRILLISWFERQFAIPELPPKLFEGFLKWYEDHILKVDIRDIRLNRPIFVIALPRSGSSILQDILCTHPDIAYITNTMHLFRTCFCAAEYFRKRFNLNSRGERYLRDSIEVDSGSPSEGIAFWGEWLKDDPYSLNYVERKIEDFSSLELENIYTSICKIIWCFEGKASRFFTKNPALLPRFSSLKICFLTLNSYTWCVTLEPVQILSSNCIILMQTSLLKLEPKRAIRYIIIRFSFLILACQSYLNIFKNMVLITFKLQQVSGTTAFPL